MALQIGEYVEVTPMQQFFIKIRVMLTYALMTHVKETQNKKYFLKFRAFNLLKS